jgi:hypothetical protein
MEVFSVEQRMEQPLPPIQGRMKTPRAAAIAGIIFSVLLTTTIVLLRVSVTAVSQGAQAGPTPSSHAVELALNLVPFAGIAFLWFIGVVRDRFGVYEDRFFATVFLGSGILFLAMFFAPAAMAGAILIALDTVPNPMIDSGVYVFGRAIIARIMNVYALKMAGVFIMSTATIAMRTGILPRWITFLGYGLALMLLLSSHFFDWLGLAFPLWVLIMSIFILVENMRAPTVGTTTNEIGGNV